MSFAYTDYDQQRRYPEPPARDRAGSVFDTDRLRVLASQALRRLAGKTQVQEPDAGAVPHNRLTHSLDVAVVGARIAHALGADRAVVETACLAHDLGHPPFGHNGEQVLRAKARAHGASFEANAQTLRILTHLEPTTAPDRTGGGLNLTRASLDAVCKYPWTPGPHRKYGAYPEDADTLSWIRAGVASAHNRLCLEAQIMDFADDVANTAADITNAIRSGAITFAPLAPLAAPATRTELVKLARGHFTTLDEDEIDSYTGDLLQQPLIAAHSGTDPLPDSALAAVGQMLADRFIVAAVDATRAVAGPGPHQRFRTDLLVPARARGEIAILKALHLHVVLREPALRARRAWQREVLDTVFDALLDRAPTGFDPIFAARGDQSGSDSDRVQVVLDQLAAFTDRRAIEMFHQLTDAPKEGRAGHMRQAARSVARIATAPSFLS